jgi:hypothetical protein
MVVRTYHLDFESVRKEHIPAGEIPWGDLKDLKIGVVTVDPPSIAAGASANVDVTVTGLYNPTAAAIDGLARPWFYIAWIP